MDPRKIQKFHRLVKVVVVKLSQARGRPDPQRCEEPL